MGRSKWLGSFRAMCVSSLAWVMVTMTPALAYAEKYMNDIDMTRVIDPNTHSVAKQTFGLTVINIIQDVMTKFLLPVGIFMSIWRSAYIAIFCVMAHTDPLHVINEKNLSFIRGESGTSTKARRANRIQENLEYGDSGATFGDFEAIEPEIGIRALQDELRKSARSLVVVLALWTFLRIIAYIVYWTFTVLGM